MKNVVSFEEKYNIAEQKIRLIKEKKKAKKSFVKKTNAFIKSIKFTELIVELEMHFNINYLEKKYLDFIKELIKKQIKEKGTLDKKLIYDVFEKKYYTLEIDLNESDEEKENNEENENEEKNENNEEENNEKSGDEEIKNNINIEINKKEKEIKNEILVEKTKSENEYMEEENKKCEDNKYAIRKYRKHLMDVKRKLKDNKKEPDIKYITFLNKNK